MGVILERIPTTHLALAHDTLVGQGVTCVISLHNDGAMDYAECATPESIEVAENALYELRRAWYVDGLPELEPEPDVESLQAEIATLKAQIAAILAQLGGG